MQLKQLEFHYAALLEMYGCLKVGQCYSADKSLSDPKDNYFQKLWCYTVDSDLANGHRYPLFVELGPGSINPLNLTIINQ